MLIGYAIAISTFSHLGVPQIYNRFFPAIKKKGQLLFFSILLTFLGFLLTSSSILLLEDEILSFLNASKLLREYFIYIILLVFFISFYNVYASVSRSFLESTTPIFLNEVFLRLYTLVILIIHGLKWIDYQKVSKERLLCIHCKEVLATKKHFRKQIFDGPKLFN